MAKTTKTTTPTTKSVSMTLSKSTKGTHVYLSADDEAICTQVYLSRSALPDEPPKTIVLSVEFGE